MREELKAIRLDWATLTRVEFLQAYAMLVISLACLVFILTDAALSAKR